MKIFIGSDHGGFNLKEILIASLATEFEVEDMGAFELNPNDDYPTYAIKVAEAVQRHTESIGILICKSGIGVCITANRFGGIYAANVHDVQTAKLAREHNNANIICIDGSMDQEIATDIVKNFLSSEFTREERHIRRLNMIEEIDASQVELKDLITDLPIQDLPLNS